MTAPVLEHVNLTVSDPAKTAAMLHDIFGWAVRWQGASLGGGTTYHVGNETTYLALYNPNADTSAPPRSYDTINGLNHVGIVVDDLDATETRVKAAGFKTTNHGDYEPGKRFYFHDHDGIEFEVVSYA